MIEILHMDKRVGRSWILRDVNTVLQPGLTVIVGANGSGKSTLIRCIAGQWRPTRGEIRLNGKPVGRLGPEVGVLLDPPSFYEHLTASEMLAYYVHLAGRKWTPEYDELLHRFGVPEGRIRGFSRGQKQRLGIVCSVWSQPKVWILDEPFTGLDARGVDALWKEVDRALRTHAEHVVMVLHAAYGFPQKIRQVVRISNHTVDFRGSRVEFAQQVLVERNGKLDARWADVLKRNHVPFQEGENPTEIILSPEAELFTYAVECLLNAGFQPLADETAHHARSDTF
ncbi:MAG: ABC transporter ATP-binding protein [Alicyclobacillus mali]|uniref:ATP-binding cassette domain-containing protein n=1 Tax=Alicyclobacillus mali (ex Roth et al. 2021) TaxID=1123961 RepID=UPI0023F193BD|nr:ABC transporter ATP-binding protein [Alicyclobacillus mali (ex Roth et al. 2021)]MCL6489466.1 ABC transporter ATP-binding protein [Alicyclobacillus mali (ex Roth et al. 2021)]